MDLLKNVSWAFNSVDYSTTEAFNLAVTSYHDESGTQHPSWNPDEIVLETPSVQIAYRYYITPTDKFFADEFFLNSDDTDLLADDTDETSEQREATATFMADNGFYFTAVELMYKIHQRLLHRQLGDYIYFEGLFVCNIPERITPPLFYLHCSN